MRRLFLFTAIFLGGCGTTSTGERTSMFAMEYSHENPETWTTGTYVENYDDLTLKFRAEAMDPKTGFKLHMSDSVEDYFDDMKTHIKVVRYCEKISGSKCVLSRYGDKIYYASADDYSAKTEQARLRQVSLKEKRKAEILASLVDRCMNFGWNDDDQISACVQQESYRDLQLARQKREIASLERRLASATKVEEKPFYLEALEILTEEVENRENQQMKLDIAKLKGKAGIR